MLGLGPGETTLVLLLIVLLIFGPSQLPKLMKALGGAVRDFRKAQREVSDELNREPPETKPKDTEKQ